MKTDADGNPQLTGACWNNNSDEGGATLGKKLSSNAGYICGQISMVHDMKTR